MECVLPYFFPALAPFACRNSYGRANSGKREARWKKEETRKGWPDIFAKKHFTRSALRNAFRAACEITISLAVTKLMLLQFSQPFLFSSLLFSSLLFSSLLFFLTSDITFFTFFLLSSYFLFRFSFFFVSMEGWLNHVGYSRSGKRGDEWIYSSNATLACK